MIRSGQLCLPKGKYIKDIFSSIPILPENTVEFSAVNQSISTINSTSFTACSSTLTTINLQGNKLTSASDENFDGLQVLANLFLQDNVIQSFNFKSGIDTLTTLSLHDNRIGASLNISMHSNLNEVDVSNNQLTGLTLAPAISTLNIGYNIFPTGLPSFPASLAALKIDGIAINGLDGTIFSSTMNNLNTMTANSCAMKSLSSDFFSKTPSLQTFYANSNLLSAEKVPVGTFAPASQLVNLDLSNNVQFGQNFLPALCSDVPNLESLVYSSTGLKYLNQTDCSLSSLYSLDISSNPKITDIPEDSILSSMTSLADLDVSFSKLTTVAGGLCSRLSQEVNFLGCSRFSKKKLQF